MKLKNDPERVWEKDGWELWMKKQSGYVELHIKRPRKDFRIHPVEWVSTEFKSDLGKKNSTIRGAGAARRPPQKLEQPGHNHSPSAGVRECISID
jgi:hypothetical protein